MKLYVVVYFGLITDTGEIMQVTKAIGPVNKAGALAYIQDKHQDANRAGPGGDLYLHHETGNAICQIVPLNHD